MANEACANMGDERMPMCPGQAERRGSDAGELKMLAELGRMPGRLPVGNRRPNGRYGHPKARKSAIQSISGNRTDVTGTNQGHDRGFAATFTRALSHRAFSCPPATGTGSTGTAETIYFRTDKACFCIRPPPIGGSSHGQFSAVASPACCSQGKIVHYYVGNSRHQEYIGSQIPRNMQIQSQIRLSRYLGTTQSDHSGSVEPSLHRQLQWQPQQRQLQFWDAGAEPDGDYRLVDRRKSKTIWLPRRSATGTST